MSSATEVAAYYFPNYHPDPRNAAWHGEGWTEWELVRAARPRYPGHRQPVRPAWGYFDESDPAWAAREIDLAADHGVTCFLYDWYWWEDGPYLQDGLERGFLRAPNRRRVKFALMWANHDWVDIHPVGYRNRPEVLARGAVSAACFIRLTNHAIQAYFGQPNYLRPEGRPYFSIYELGTLLRGLGGLDGTREALEDFRRRARLAGHPDLHLNAVVWGVNVLPTEMNLPDPVSVVAALGLDSITSYAWVHHYDPSTHGFPVGSYAEAMKRNVRAWSEYRAQFAIPYYPNVSMGWDSSPRTVQSDVFAPRGYPFSAVLGGNTPSRFRHALRQAKGFVEQISGFRMVTINAWNEWTEGSYLLPDTRHGTAYLEAVKAVFGGSVRNHRL